MHYMKTMSAHTHAVIGMRNEWRLDGCPSVNFRSETIIVFLRVMFSESAQELQALTCCIAITTGL